MSDNVQWVSSGVDGNDANDGLSPAQEPLRMPLTDGELVELETLWMVDSALGWDRTLAKAALTELRRLRARERILADLLTEGQWACGGCNCHPDDECYHCGAQRAEGDHKPGCALAAVLSPSPSPSDG